MVTSKNEKRLKRRDAPKRLIFEVEISFFALSA
jgi:hypothetical protein